MANKLGPKEITRLLELKYKQGLTDAIIAIRLGVSERTVRVYTRAARQNHKPYHPKDKLELPTSTPDVSSGNQPETP